jgi:hypothetical protein
VYCWAFHLSGVAPARAHFVMLQLVQAVMMTFFMLSTCSGQSQVAGDVQRCQGRKLYPAGTGDHLFMRGFNLLSNLPAACDIMQKCLHDSQ